MEGFVDWLPKPSKAFCTVVIGKRVQDLCSKNGGKMGNVTWKQRYFNFWSSELENAPFGNK